MAFHWCQNYLHTYIIRKVIQIEVEGTLRLLKKMVSRKRALKVSQVSNHINIINIYCRKLKFSMLIDPSVWHTVVKVHKNSYVSFCYRIVEVQQWKLAEIILKCDWQHTKLMFSIGIALVYKCYYHHTKLECYIGIKWEAMKRAFLFWRWSSVREAISCSRH